MDQWRYQTAHDLGLPEGQRLRSPRRESGLVGLVMRNAWWFFVRGYFAMGQRVHVDGMENLPPAPPFVLVANHCSHLDALLLASALPLKLRNHVFPIAAGDTFFETPILTAFAAGTMNALPLWRKNAGHHALTDLRERLLGEPCGYILFPEGTRSRTGEINRFRAGMGMLIAQTAVPVVPCLIEGTHRALPVGRKIPRRTGIRLRIGPALSFADAANNREGWESIAQKLEAAVRGLSGEI